MKIRLIPIIDAVDLSNKVEEEFEKYEVSTHYQNDMVTLDWEEEDSYPEFQKWLVEIYGEEIKQYGQFAIQAT